MIRPSAWRDGGERHIAPASMLTSAPAVLQGQLWQKFARYSDSQGAKRAGGVLTLPFWQSIMLVETTLSGDSHDRYNTRKSDVGLDHSLGKPARSEVRRGERCLHHRRDLCRRDATIRCRQ